MLTADPAALPAAGLLFGTLALASAAGALLARRATTPAQTRLAADVRARTNAWWGMALAFSGALALGRVATVVFFALVSFAALREMLTLTPSRRGDHRTLFWAFFVATPAQYALLAADWYGLFAVFLPVYGFLFFALRSALGGDAHNYLERVAKVQWATFACVYCLSHVPALHLLEGVGPPWRLVAWVVAVCQASDVLQYVWGKALGRRKIAPTLSPNKTVEGYAGGTLSAALLGVALGAFLTPFAPWQDALLALLVAQLGFAGGLVMSATKRDAGVKDYGYLLPGHGGAMDRVDSLAFAAPPFFHAVRYFFASS